MDVVHSIALQPLNVDGILFKAAEASPGEPLRLRLQPQVFHAHSTPRAGFVGWRGVHWNLSFASVKEVIAFRKTLALFFGTVAAVGCGPVTQALRAIPVDNEPEAVGDSAAVTAEQQSAA